MQAILTTPIGPMPVTTSAAGLERLCFPPPEELIPEGIKFAGVMSVGIEPMNGKKRPHGAAIEHLHATARFLEAYFSGAAIVCIPTLAPISTSRFQRRVWQTLSEVPFGTTLSYAELGVAAGYPGTARAVGGAMRANPLVLVVPCHRVLGSAGQLGGFSGGLDLKAALLEHEGHEVGPRGVRRNCSSELTLFSLSSSSTD